jgi:hypothetical protein
MTQAELAYKQAQTPHLQAETRGLDIANQFSPERLRLANEYAALQNRFYTPNIQSEILSRNALTNKILQMTPLEAEELRLKNKNYEDLIKAQIEAQKSLSKYRELGGAGMGVPQKELMGLKHQIQIEHPDWTPDKIDQAGSAYLSGENTLPTGESLPPASGLVQTHLDLIQGRKATAAIKNQAAQMDVLYDELENFDIDAVKEFAGPRGKAKLLEAKTKMAINPDDPTIDPKARRFIAAMQQSIINMDAMRKAFGTSVVPDYVYSTLGRLTNPADSIWNDPKQVWINYKQVVDSIKRTRDIISAKAKHGATYRLPEESGTTSAEQKVKLYSPTGEYIGQATRSNAARFLKDHPGHYQKVL